MTYQVTFLDAFLMGGYLLLAAAAYIVQRASPRLSQRSILTISILAIFFQYQLSLWISLGAGGWTLWIVRGEMVTLSLGLVLLFSVSMVLGYVLRRRVLTPNIHNSGIRFSANIITGSRRHAQLAILFATLTVLGMAINVGFDNFWVSTYLRGDFAGSTRTALQKLADQMYTVSLISGFVATLMATFSFIRLPTAQKIIVFPLYLLFIAVCSAPIFWWFSRLAGAMYFVAAMLMYFLRDKRGRQGFYLWGFIALGVYLSIVGITHRSVAPPGYGSFLNAALFPNAVALARDFQGADPFGYSISPSINFLDALAPTTARLFYSGVGSYFVLDAIARLVLMLQPLPAVLFPQSWLRVDDSLSVFLGTQGNVGITSPALGELFVLFGWWSFIPGFLLGMALRWADRKVSERHNMAAFLGLCLIIMAIVTSGHSGIRAFARPFVLGVIILWFSGKKIRLNRT